MNKTLIISYDLKKAGRNYEPLHKAIKSYNGWAKLGSSAYVIVANASPATVRDHLQAFIDTNDSLFVGVVSAPAAWINYGDAVSKWLREQLN